MAAKAQRVAPSQRKKTKSFTMSDNAIATLARLQQQAGEGKSQSEILERLILGAMTSKHAVQPAKSVLSVELEPNELVRSHESAILRLSTEIASRVVSRALDDIRQEQEKGFRRLLAGFDATLERILSLLTDSLQK